MSRPVRRRLGRVAAAAAAAAEEEYTQDDPTSMPRHTRHGSTGSSSATGGGGGAPLTSVLLSHQQLGSDAMASIGELICHSPDLVQADLSFNHLCAQGAWDLLRPITAGGCPTLEHLSLAHNVLGDEACEAVAELLRTHPRLESIDLTGNGITCVGAQKIARALQSTVALTSLRLGSNPLAGGGVALALGLQSAPRSNLRELSLESTQADDAVAQHLALALAHCPALRRVDLHDNPNVSGPLAHRIAATLTRRDQHHALAMRDLSATDATQVLQSLTSSILAQPLPDFCCDLTRLLVQYYADIETAVQDRIQELNPTHQPQSYSLAPCSEELSEEDDDLVIVPIRKRRNGAPDVTDRVRLHLYLQLFPLVVHQLVESLQVFKALPSSSPAVATEPCSSPSSAASSRSSSGSFAALPAAQSSLWDAYVSLGLLVGVVLLRADKAIAAVRARAYVENETVALLTKQRRAPHLPRGHSFIDHNLSTRSVPSTPLRRRRDHPTQDSPPRSSASSTTSLHSHKRGAPSLQYPTQTLLFESDIQDQLQDSFHVLLTASLTLKSSLLRQAGQLHLLVRQEDISALDDLFRIATKELDTGIDRTTGVDTGELRLLDELVMARSWTNVPQLASSIGFASGVDEPIANDATSLVKLIYLELERAIAERFDVLIDQELANSPEAIEQQLRRVEDEIEDNGHRRGSSTMSSSSSRSSLAPLLATMKELVADLSMLKHKLTPLVARARRQQKQLLRERLETTERRPHTRTDGSSGSNAPEHLDLFSFVHERYHQRLVHCFVSPRFLPTGLDLPDILSCVSWISFYERFLRGLFCTRGAVADAERMNDYEQELEAYSESFMDEWTTRQTEKARPWWSNIHRSEITSPPELGAEFGDDGEPTPHGLKQRVYYSTHAPQDLFSKLNAFVDLALDEHALRGRALYRVGVMVVEMACVFLRQHRPWMDLLRKACEEYVPLRLVSSLYKEKDLFTAAGALRLDLLSKGQLSSLKEAHPLRRGCENKLVDKDTIREREKRRKETEKKAKELEKLNEKAKKNGTKVPEKDEHQEEEPLDDFDELEIGPPRLSLSSSSSSAHPPTRPFADLRSSLIQVLAQLNNVSLYRFQLEKTLDQILDVFEAEEDDAAEAQENDSDEPCGEAGHSASSSRVHSDRLQAVFDDAEDVLTDQVVHCTGVLADICADRCLGVLNSYWNESNLKRVFAANEKNNKKAALDYVPVVSTRLMHSLLACVQEFLSFCLPQIRKSTEAALLIKYTLHSLVVHYVSFLLSAPKMSALTPQRKLALVLQQVTAEKAMLQEFFGHKAMRRDGEEESEEEEDADTPSLPSLDNSCLRALAQVKELQSSFGLLQMVEDLLSADADFLQLHHEELVKRYPVIGGQLRMCGLDCILLVQGCMRLRGDLEKRRIHALVADLLQFVAVRQCSEPLAASLAATASSSSPNNGGSHVKGAKSDDSDCVIC